MFTQTKMVLEKGKFTVLEKKVSEKLKRKLFRAEVASVGNFYFRKQNGKFEKLTSYDQQSETQ